MNELDSRHMDELAALLAVAKEESFVGAGRALQRDPTIVSKRIASLEGRLGVRLVERTTRRVRLTEAGAKLSARLKEAANLILEAEEEAALGSKELRGKLKLAFPAAMGRIWLAPLLPSFMDRYPALEVEIDYSERYVDIVAEGFDAAIRIGVLNDSRLIAKKLGSHRVTFSASPSYVERYGLPASPRDLAAHKIIEYAGFAASQEWRLSNGERRETVRVRGLMRTNDLPAMLEAARAGAGILGAGEWLMARDIAAGKLVPILAEWTFDTEGAIHLLRPSVDYTPARTEAFVAWISEQFRNGLPWKDL